MVRHVLATVRPTGQAAQRVVRDVQAIAALPAGDPQRLLRQQLGLERPVLVPINRLGKAAGTPLPDGAVAVQLTVPGFEHCRYALPATMHTMEQLLEVDGEVLYALDVLRTCGWVDATLGVYVIEVLSNKNSSWLLIFSPFKEVQAFLELPADIEKLERICHGVMGRICVGESSLATLELSHFVPRSLLRRAEEALQAALLAQQPEEVLAASANLAFTAAVVMGPDNIKAFLTSTLNTYMNLYEPRLLLESGIPFMQVQFSSGRPVPEHLQRACSGWVAAVARGMAMHVADGSASPLEQIAVASMDAEWLHTLHAPELGVELTAAMYDAHFLAAKVLTLGAEKGQELKLSIGGVPTLISTGASWMQSALGPEYTEADLRSLTGSLLVAKRSFQGKAAPLPMLLRKALEIVEAEPADLEPEAAGILQIALSTGRRQLPTGEEAEQRVLRALQPLLQLGAMVEVHVAASKGAAEQEGQPSAVEQAAAAVRSAAAGSSLGFAIPSW
ncbi:UDP-glucuronate 5-epimerase [Chlorella sorokiniana]|uniref:UDP-glucuronate 5-epimerase n=1 Tax=Chlorella sorokiniana TaxID=3076 RepID=A0A2P6TT86_CHLSO|nr:UDP-glucuronate 5-epimerase [Chlorella sorokiniana]|eukprot:PRW57264.1 UDP-glucuronate 5-epimerase [Chlorella sorokiniana]